MYMIDIRQGKLKEWYSNIAVARDLINKRLLTLQK